MPTGITHGSPYAYPKEDRQVCVFVNKNRLSPVGRRTLPAGLPLITVHHEKRIRQGWTPENRRRPKAEIHRLHKTRYRTLPATQNARPNIRTLAGRSRPAVDRTRLSEGADAARASRLYGPTQRHRPEPEPTDQTGQYRRFRLGRSFARSSRCRDRGLSKTPPP